VIFAAPFISLYEHTDEAALHSASFFCGYVLSERTKKTNGLESMRSSHGRKQAVYGAGASGGGHGARAPLA